MQRYINPYRLFQGAMVPNCVMRRQDLSQTAKLVYGRLCQYAGKNGEAFPSLERLAGEVGLTSWRQAHRVVTELKDFGLLQVVKRAAQNGRGDGRGNSYLFLDHPIFYADDDEYQDGGKSSPPGKKSGRKKPETPDDTDIENNMTEMSGVKKCMTSNDRIPVKADKKSMSELSLEENHIRESVEENQKKPRGCEASAAEPSSASQSAADSRQKNEHKDKPKNEAKKPSERFSEQDLALARRMLTVLAAGNPGFRPPARVEKWADEIRLMRERDRRPLEEIGHVFDFAAADAFWRQNILSPAALRRNYAKLTARMLAQGHRFAPSKEEKKPVHRCGDCRDFGQFDCVGISPNQVGCCVFSPRNKPLPMFGGPSGNQERRGLQA